MKKTKISSRVIASILSLMMVISIFPLSGNVYAATEAHPDAVTITVTDENGQPIKDAAVAIVVDSVANGEAYISETKKTDETGVVDVLASDAFVAEDLTISATVTAEGYADGELSAKVIESGDENFDVALKDKTIRDVRIEGKTLTYNGSAQELVSVTKLEGDTVEYYYPADDENASTDVPEESNAGTYSVKVVVKRDGMDDLVDTVTSTINPADIEGISIAGKNMAYEEGLEQELVTLTGAFEEDDVVTWTVNGEAIVSHDIPKVIAVDTYNISLTVNRGSNFNELRITGITSKLIEGELKLDGLTVDGLDGVYTVEDGEAVAQKVVSVKNKGNYDLQYQLDDGDLTVNDNAWVDEIPTVTDAGSYIVWVKAVKESYKDAEVTVNPAENAVAPYNVFVAKASQSLEFDAEAPSEVTLGENNEYDFAATGENLSEKDIEYSLVDATADDVATITADGKLTVKNAGIVTVKAFRPGNDNYQDAVVYKTVVVKNAGTELVTFDKDSKYILDADGVVSEKTANKANNNDNGVVSYSIDNKTIGLAIDSTNGKITVENLSKLTEAMGIAGSVSVEVTAEKTEGSLDGVEWVFDAESGWKKQNINKNVFGEDSDTYIVEITYDNTITSEDIIVAEADPSGWHNAANLAVITPKDAEKYTIALGNIDLDAFGEAVTIEEQGIGTHYVYLKNEETKQISAAIAVDVKVDTEKPDANEIKIEYYVPTKDAFLEIISLGFYNPSVTVKLTATDVTSGIDYFTWNYTKEVGASEINHPASVKGQKVEAIQDAEDSTKYTAEFTITADEENQYRGYLDVTATDKANNTSDVKTDDGNVFVVDTINPQMSIKFQGAEDYTNQIDAIDTVHYFNGDVKVELTITEANFYGENVKVLATKDGKPYNIDELNWSERNSKDESVAEFMLSGDGDFVVYVEAKDESGNKTEYTSETITVDTTLPEIEATYDEEAQNITITINEHNFRASDVTVVTDAKDINENNVTINDLQAYAQNEDNWTSEGDSHTLVLESTGDNKVLVDAYYKQFTVDYADLSDNKIEKEAVIEEALIDHTAPADLQIKYEKSIVDVILENVTFGFYNPSVTVVFTAYDDNAGVEYFTWGYTRSEDASNIEHPENLDDTVVLAEQDNTDKSKFTATITLTAKEAEQYRGYLNVQATDTFKNSGDKIEDNGNIIVVDTIAPELTVEFSPAANNENPAEHFYNGNVVATITSTEANFNADDVVITVTKNGETFDFGDDFDYVVWGSRNKENDKTVGTLTLPAPEDHSGDGHYVVNIAHKDKSGNFDEEKSTYTSHILTIDTTIPEITSVYNKEKQNITFTINEHNFRASDVKVVAEAWDINGKAVSVNDIQAYMQDEANWTTVGDVHTLVLESTGENPILVDAYYKLTTDYTDLAKKSAESNILDGSLIDHTKPTDPTIEFLTNPVQTLARALTFGFYNPSVKVRLTSYDAGAGVVEFVLGYTKDENASAAINHPGTIDDTAIEELDGDKISKDFIKADDNDKSKFTTEFTIPASEVAQYRGYLSAKAIDDYANESGTFDDKEKIFVVDTIAPGVEVKYSSDTEDAVENYYNKALDVEITVTEANFYSEDIKVTVTKNGENFDYGTVEWGSRDEADKTVGEFTLSAPENHSGDGHYVVSIEYTDKSGNSLAKGEDEDNYISYEENGKTIYKYESDVLTIDTTAPVIDVEYQNNDVINTLKDRDGNNRKYFNKAQTAIITITEHNFDSEKVDIPFVAVNVNGVKVKKDIEDNAWEKVEGKADTYSKTITYNGDANYTFDIAYTDKASNPAADYKEDYFTVDTTAPEFGYKVKGDEVLYKDKLGKLLEIITFGFYKEKVFVTITATDNISEVDYFTYRYVKAEDVSSINSDISEQTIKADKIKFNLLNEDGSTNRAVASATFKIPKEALNEKNQFNGTVEFNATDRAGNTPDDAHKENERVVIDNIRPKVKVGFSDAINTVGDIAYYNGNIDVKITVTEANFYSKDFKLEVLKDGKKIPQKIKWVDDADDEYNKHIGTFTLKEDGDYFVNISYTDRSGNVMKTNYKPTQKTIDTNIKAPTLSVNGSNGGAYSKDVNVAYSFEDINFDTSNIKLTRRKFDTVEDVTSEFIGAKMTGKGGSGSFKIPNDVKNDGIYTLSINMADKAKHTTSSQMTFTVNRHGPVYVYDDYLVSLIKDGGQYKTLEKGNKTAITEDLVIYVYNACEIKKDTLEIELTRGSETVDVVDYIWKQVTGNSGWYQYECVIDADNFKEDGLYKITLKSKYDTVDSNTSHPSRTDSEEAIIIDDNNNKIVDTMCFTVDTTAPEIRTITNLDEKVPDKEKIIDGKLTVKYDIIEAGGLASIQVIVNGNKTTIEDFGNNIHSYSGEIVLEQADKDAQTVQLIITDKAGNVTDTNSKEFLEAHSEKNEDNVYVFFNEVTVTSSPVYRVIANIKVFFEEWYANKPLFWGSIAGVVVVAGAAGFIIVSKKKKKEDQ